jgi:hypothetical protein
VWSFPRRLLSVFLISFVLQIVLLAVCQVVNAIGPKERLDADKTYFDGAKTYEITLSSNIPEKNLWSVDHPL